MLWKGRRSSGNIDDRRGMSGGGIAVGGGVIGVIALILNFLLGGDPQLAEQIPIGNDHVLTDEQKAAEDEMAEFVGVVLAETEDVWNKIMAEKGRDYPEPTLVLFSNVVQSSCGNASSASGPFYCPADSKVYIDLSFYEELKNRFKAPGDFAMAYVVAHEVGHHVQNYLGVTDKMNELRGRVSKTEYNRYSVMLELQADFLAGVWAHHTQKMKNILEEGDIEEALNAANAIGDDRLQEQSQGYIVPDAFTHGTSEQRMFWFKKGYKSGDIDQGNTFAAMQ